ncbi:MAG: VWA domain-containing protein [Chthoniobacterales bacterium]
METSALTFGQPAVLHFLWLLLPVATLYWWAERRRRVLVGRIVAPKLRALLAGNTSPLRRIFRGACVLGALGLLVVALAEPRLGYDTLEVPHRGRDVVIAMDVSRSMLATDVAPSRLQRAKLLAEDLVSELGGDRLGLVAFAGSAFLQAPLTLDHGAVLTAIDELDTELIPRGGTNINAAVRASEEAFTKAEGFSRAIIIISDGEELDADGVAAARNAAGEGVRIFTVGVGSSEGSEIPLGPGDFVRDPSGKIVQSRLDAARLREIAEVTGGFYTPLDDNAARMLAVDGIGKMAEADITVGSSRRPIERYQWPLGAAIALLVLQALVGERRRLPLGAVAAALCLLGALPAQASGLSAYQQGNFKQAGEEFENRLKMEPGAPNLQLNAGAAAYQLQDYAKASQYFSKAMLAADPALRSAAEFNLGNTLFRQGEGQQDKEKKVSDWQDAIKQYDAALKTQPDYTEAKENKERVEELLQQLENEQEQPEQKQDQQDQQQKDEQQKQDEQQQQDGPQDEQKPDEQGGQEKKEPSGDGGEDEKEQQGQSQDEQKQDGQGGEKDQQQQDGDQEEEKQDEQGRGDKPDEQKPEGQPDEPEPGRGDQPPDDGAGGEKESEQGSPSRPGDREQEGSGGQSGDSPAPVPTPSGDKKEGQLRAADDGDGEPQEAAAEGAAGEEKPGEMSESQARALLRSLQGEEEKVDLLERRAFQDVSRDW